MSAEMHEHIGIWQSELGKINAEIAELANCRKCTIQEVFRLYQELVLFTTHLHDLVVNAVL